MKTRKFKSAAIMLFVMAFGFVACKKEGKDGADGKDGNANVQVIMIDSGTTWSSNTMSLSVPEITSEVMTSYGVLAYAFTGTLAYPIPGPYSNGVHIIRTYMSVGNYTLRAHNWDGTVLTTPSTVDSVKLVLMEGTKMSSVENNTMEMMETLENAHVDLNNPNEVIEYLRRNK